MTIWHLFIPVVVLFGAWTVDRFVHLLWAGAFFVGFLVLARGYRAVASDRSLLVRYWIAVTHPPNRGHAHGLALALFVLFLGSWLPDIDWKFGIHRSPITHSVLPYLVMAAAAKWWAFGDRIWSLMLTPVFGIALGSHLIIDFFQGGNLVGIGMEYEFAFYAANGFAAILLSCLAMRRRLAETLPSQS